MSRLSISFAVDRYDAMHFGPEESAIREGYARRDLGMKFLESLDVDQPMTVRLHRHVYKDPRVQATVTTLDLEVMAVQTMRVEMREFEPLRWKIEPPAPPVVAPKPGVFGCLWDGWKKHVDQCRESLGG
jgi:hypothetical protein